LSLAAVDRATESELKSAEDLSKKTSVFVIYVNNIENEEGHTVVWTSLARVLIRIEKWMVTGERVQRA